jgi:hypothetical protein
LLLRRLSARAELALNNEWKNSKAIGMLLIPCAFLLLQIRFGIRQNIFWQAFLSL